LPASGTNSRQLRPKNVRLLEENRHTAESLKEDDRRKDEFLTTLAHEGRNPLAPSATG